MFNTPENIFNIDIFSLKKRFSLWRISSAENEPIGKITLELFQALGGGLDLSDWRGLLDFWRRMKIKMAAVT